MEGIDQYSASNPFTVEEYGSEAPPVWDSSAVTSEDATTTVDYTSNGVADYAVVEGITGEGENGYTATPVVSDGPLDRARLLAGDLANTLRELSEKLDETGAERARVLNESAELQRQIALLEEHKAAKETMVNSVLNGPGGDLSSEDLRTIQAMMDALTQDPDRLTVLFTVVQHAGELATIISDYTQLRRLAEEEQVEHPTE